jgi:predicted GNAT superfamily acetyltransferase
MTQGDADQEAKDVAARAKVTVREVDTVADLHAVAELMSRIWDAPRVAPMPHDIMRSLVHAGGRVHAAFRDGQLAGACVAVFGPPVEASCYSLIAGVSPVVESQGIGLALKLAQRAWALRVGASRMTWTFDPLLRRNARFNITRLGAVVTDYLVDFYGEIPDGVNDPETDRLAVTWDLRKPLPGSARSSGPPNGQTSAGQDKPLAILGPGQHGEPVLALGPAVSAGSGSDQAAGAKSANSTSTDAGDDRTDQLRCWIPEDILATRRANPELAGRWRMALREALGGALSDGYAVTGLMDPGWYVLQKMQAGR